MSDRWKKWLLKIKEESFFDTHVWILELPLLSVLAFVSLDVYYLIMEGRFGFLFEQILLDRQDIDFSICFTNVLLKIFNARARVVDCVY